MTSGGKIRKPHLPPPPTDFLNNHLARCHPNQTKTAPTSYVIINKTLVNASHTNGSNGQIVQTVERLYCKRPIQCLASSKISATPPPPHPTSVYPRLWCGGRGWTNSQGGKGVGVNIMEDARHCSVLYIRNYFVLHPLVI